MELAQATFDTPVGPMRALASDTALCALEFESGPRLSRLDARLSQHYADVTIVEQSSAVLAQTRAWLDAYFAGASADIAALTLDARGTPFEQTVWSALRAIPVGETTSYGRIAAQVATVAASRAVGLANGANPIAIIVPCHRVIGSAGSLTGYGGGLDRKLWLLEHEERYWPTTSSLSRVGQSSRTTMREQQSRQQGFNF
jgi:O-6-methylguanine DNA methyltransferase